MNMGIMELRLVESVAVLLVATITILVSNASASRVAVKYNFEQERVRFTRKIIRSLVIFVGGVALLFIWGVDQKELVLFLTSFVAVVGIALFAQWSMLSNITASILLFTSHPAKIGDTIAIQDKEFDLRGRITDIGMFFTSIQTLDDQVVTIPNNLFFQKIVKLHSN